MGLMKFMRNRMLEDIINDIDKKFKCLQIDFENGLWRRSIPSEPGWYLIKTNTPIPVLESIGKPQHRAHIDIPEAIKNTLILQNLGIAVIQSEDKDFVVYNGEAENLKARAREHECGHPKTYCLGLSNYEALRRYRWAFCYVAVSSCRFLLNKDKLLRLAVEQGWRAKNGWPILSRK